jgi:WD40 repeat protein
MSVTRLTISPDGSLAIVEGWGSVYVLDTRTWAESRRFPESSVAEKRYGSSNPHFTPDGKYLLMQSDQPALRILDTETWQPLPHLQGMPVDALDWFPASSARRSVYLTNNGQVALWNPDEKRDVAVLDGDSSYILSLAWSPDESMVAIATVRQPGDGLPVSCRIRIESGTRKTAPLCKSFGLLNRRLTPYTGCFGGLTENTSWPRDDRRLVAGCGDGVIRVWDTPPIVEELTAFEHSLTEDSKAGAQP